MIEALRKSVNILGSEMGWRTGMLIEGSTENYYYYYRQRSAMRDE